MALKWIDRGLSIVVSILYAVITAVAFAQVLVRYALGGSLAWSEEAVRFLFISLSFLGFSITMNRGAHRRRVLGRFGAASGGERPRLGLRRHHLDMRELQRVVRPVYDEFTKSVGGKDWVKRILEVR